jgi:hypothetical protein
VHKILKSKQTPQEYRIMSKLEPCRWGPEITQEELDGLVDIVCLAASGTQCCAAFICTASYEYSWSTRQSKVSLETFWFLELDPSRAVEREKEVQAGWIVSTMMNTHPLKIETTPKR